MQYIDVYEVDLMYRRLRDLREDADLTQKQVGQLLHISQQVYANYELGQRDIPTSVLVDLARLYHCSVDYLLGLTDIKKPYRAANDAIPVPHRKKDD